MNKREQIIKNNISRCVDRLITEITYRPCNSHMVCWNFLAFNNDPVMTPTPEVTSEYDLPVWDIDSKSWRLIDIRYVTHKPVYYYSNTDKIEVSMLVTEASNELDINNMYNDSEYLQSKYTSIDEFKENLHTSDAVNYINSLTVKQVWGTKQSTGECEEMYLEDWLSMSDEEIRQCKSVSWSNIQDDQLKRLNSITTTLSPSWKRCFSYIKDAEFKTVMEMLDIDIYDFVMQSGDVNILRDCRAKWLLIIDDYKNQAIKTLDDELSEQNDILTSEVKAEIDIVKSLLNNINDEARVALEKCTDIYDVLKTWPPILLPAPEFVNTSISLSPRGIFKIETDELELYDPRVVNLNVN